KQQKPWSMYPALHENVSLLLEEYNLCFDFYNNDTDKDGQHEPQVWDTHVMGRFICHNPACAAHGWSSKMIAITIRLYGGRPRKTRGTGAAPTRSYNARVYHQRCQVCHQLSRPRLDDSYADRVAHRLKIWSGVAVPEQLHHGHSKRPHNEALCEGCAAGHCR
ncbi:hypothetical protein ASPZODRAFT_32689, partial [Penicilliopsis zonata CBS 506.65]